MLSKLCVPLITLVFALPCSAGFQYDLLFDQTNYSAVAGSGPITVNVFLRETVTGGDVARLATGGADGLFSLGARLDFGTFTGGQSVIGGTGNIAIDSSFNDIGSNVKTITGSVASVQGFATAPIEVGAAASVMTTPFASFTFTPSGTAGVTTLSLSDFNSNPLSTDSIFFDGTVIDSVLKFGSATITISAVPEPSGMMLAGLAVAGVLVRRRRR